MTTNKGNDTSERSGCQRKRTAGEMPMSDLTIIPTEEIIE